MKKGIAISLRDGSMTDLDRIQHGEFIVKVSRSIVSSVDAISILIYNEDKSVQEHFDEQDDLSRVVECLGRLQSRPKAYFNAQVNETGIKLLEEVDPQDW